MWKWICLVAAMAACSDIPGKDDPRTTIEWPADASSSSADGSGSASGTCNGQVLACTARPSTACGNDCMDAVACTSPNHDECTSYGTNATMCAEDTNCQFEVDACQAIEDGECEADISMSDCENDTSGCVWVDTCGGQPEQCGQATSASGCAALPGCTWSPPG